MSTLLQDLRYAARTLLKAPAFTAIAVLTLAFGIGANTALFSLLDAVVLRPLPFDRPGELVWIWSTRVDRDRAFFSLPNFVDFRDQNRSFTELADFTLWGANFTGQGEPERFLGVQITPNAFTMLGVRAPLGRTLLPEDARPDSPRVVLITHGLWSRRFGADPNLLGKTLSLNGDAYTVVGVLPRGFIFPGAEAEIFSPLNIDSHPRRSERGSNFTRVFGRLKPGVTLAQARIDLEALNRRLIELYPVDNGKHSAPRLMPLQDEITGSYPRALFMLSAAMGLVLLIACSNLAGLSLARASLREKEFAVRAVLGASRRRLAQQQIVESTVLALTGGVLGCLLAYWGMDLLLLLAPDDLPRTSEVAINARVLVFALVSLVLSALILGLTPAWQAARAALASRLGESARTFTAGARTTSLRRVLVVAQISLSLVLLVGAGLFLKSFFHLQQVSPGFEPANLLTLRISLPRPAYAQREAVLTFLDSTTARTASLPGVESVSVANVLPLSGQNVRADFTIVGRPPLKPTDVPAAQNRWIRPGYFHTLSIPLLAGRDFSEHDNATSVAVVVVDDTLARRYWPNENPVGARLLLGDTGALPPREVEIIGVVGNIKHNALTDEPVSTLYAPVAQITASALPFFTNSLNLVVRTSTDPLTLAGEVRRQIHAVDGNVPTTSVRSMDQFLAASVAPRRFNFLLLSVFAASALFLAATGLYAVLLFSVTQRTREIGVRIACGARPQDILRLVVGGGLRLTAIGLGVGLLVALASTRLITTLLFGVRPTDPLTFAAVSIVLLAVALLACWLPARRATRTDPITALRYE